MYIERILESWNIGLGGFVLGTLMLYLKGMRIMMLQLSGFCCTHIPFQPMDRIRGNFFSSRTPRFSEDTETLLICNSMGRDTWQTGLGTM